ncbi:hypothetical protein [Pseudomonas sp. NPDC087336]|uniref:hypothetical protein n=1 Tax=Pseudomonas sp. NPDC087336 TaxID=3364436 RepID=UPI0038142638
MLEENLPVRWMFDDARSPLYSARYIELFKSRLESVPDDLSVQVYLSRNAMDYLELILQKDYGGFDVDKDLIILSWMAATKYDFNKKYKLNLSNIRSELIKHNPSKGLDDLLPIPKWFLRMY